MERIEKPLPRSSVDYHARFVNADDEDLEQVASNARELAERFEERPGVYGIFANISWSAALAIQNEDMRRGFGGGVVPVDTSGPPSHTIDDVGTAMAWIMSWIDEPSTRPEARRIWLEILGNLAADVRDRQALRDAGA